MLGRSWKTPFPLKWSLFRAHVDFSGQGGDFFCVPFLHEILLMWKEHQPIFYELPNFLLEILHKVSISAWCFSMKFSIKSMPVLKQKSSPSRPWLLLRSVLGCLTGWKAKEKGGITEGNLNFWFGSMLSWCRFSAWRNHGIDGIFCKGSISLWLPTSTKKYSNKLFLHEIHVNLTVNQTYILYLEYIEYITTKMLRNGQQNISIVEAGSKKHFFSDPPFRIQKFFLQGAFFGGFFSNMLHFLRESITTSLTSHTLAMIFLGLVDSCKSSEGENSSTVRLMDSSTASNVERLRLPPRLWLGSAFSDFRIQRLFATTRFQCFRKKNQVKPISEPMKKHQHLIS